MKSTGSPSGRVLIVDDEKDMRDLLSHLLELEGFEPLQAGDGGSALQLMRQAFPDVVLLDINMPDIDGLTVLKEAKKFDGLTPIILITAHGSIDSVVQAMKKGAYDYVTKPFRNQELVLKVRRALEDRGHRLECWSACQPSEHESSLEELMGSSAPIGKVFAAVERVAPTDFTVIVSGETGSGKELVARAIHRQSRRAAGPFVPVDCGAIQPNLIESELFGHEKGAFTGADRARTGNFEAASGGTLFLDEIQNLPLPMQTKLLRALQEKQLCRVGSTRHLDIDTRVVAATNQDLTALAAAGHFRQDLYHRLNEFKIHVPPLRERRDDILYLARRFVHLTCAGLTKDLQGLSREAVEVLLNYPWPGNVRELRNVIRRAVLLADTHIRLEHLGPAGAVLGAEPQALHLPAGAEVNGQAPLKDLVHRSVVQVERAIILQVLRRTGGNKAEAARLLQVDYKTIRTKTKQYGISLNLSGGDYHGQK